MIIPILALFLQGRLPVAYSLDIEGFAKPLAGLEELSGVITKDHTEAIPYDWTMEDWIKKNGVNVTTGRVGDETVLVDTSKIPHPNQIRLSFTTDPTEMSITWTTNSHHEKNVVRYGTMPNAKLLSFVAYSISHQYTFGNYTNPDPDETYTSGFIHEALLINLDPGKKYYYQIESNGYNTTIGENYSFIASPGPGSETPIKILHIGDVGIFGTSVMVTKGMMTRMESNDFHSVIHCGDISYANKYRAGGDKLAWAKQEIWDTWGVMVEPITRKVPYMVSPGNHELDMYDSTMENNTIYSKRFIMPGNERYFSFAIGMVHFISVSTDESIDKGSTQHVWLDRKLAYLNQNRDKWPWIVTYQHRPIYNSNWNHGNWSGDSSYANTDDYSFPFFEGWPTDYEDLIVKYNVDFVLNGHVHHYERTWPVKDRNNTQDSYADAKGPIHITCGHGGKDLYKWRKDDKTKDSYIYPKPVFVSARSNTVWGHCELDFINKTTAKHRMYTIGEETSLFDDVLITKSWPRSTAGTMLHVNMALMLSFLFYSI